MNPSLDATHPELFSEWHPDNPPMSSTSLGSSKKFKWVCGEGHVWDQSPNSRLAGVRKNGRPTGCPFCSGLRAISGETDLATLYPQVASEWHPDNELSPSEVKPFSNRRVQWLCQYGHSWITTVSSRTGKLSRCPDCSSKGVSNIEVHLLCSLSRFGEVRHQEVVRGGYTDALMPSLRIIVEYDGVFYHMNIRDRDTRRTEEFLEEGYTVLRLREVGLPLLGIDHPDYGEVNFPWVRTQEEFNSQFDSAFIDFFQK